MQIRNAIHPDHAKQLDTTALRRKFLIESLFVPNELTLTYSHIDRGAAQWYLIVWRDLGGWHCGFAW